MNRIIPKSNSRVVMVLLAMMLTAASAWSQEATTFSGGDGTVKNPYIITTSSDWDQLATKVAEGTSYSGQYFRLDDNITITTMVGTGTKQ